MGMCFLVHDDILICVEQSAFLPVITEHVLCNSTYLARLALALVHNALLDKPQPVAKGAVEHEIRYHGGQGKRLAGLPAKLPVVVEQGACNGHGRVAQDEADVGLRVDLLELEAVEVIGQRIVGGALEI